ncbi:MAG: hypothetical protein AAGJ50_15555 [Pseudomonadota bacterium]
MRNVLNILSWAGIVILGLATAILEDLLFVVVLVPNMPASWDLTGNLFWLFTVPLSQVMALLITGTLAWFLGLKRSARLITFWACWSVGRAAFLTLINNPLSDVALYLLWIAFWCGLIALISRLFRSSEPFPAA